MSKGVEASEISRLLTFIHANTAVEVNDAVWKLIGLLVDPQGHGTNCLCGHPAANHRWGTACWGAGEKACECDYYRPDAKQLKAKAL